MEHVKQYLPRIIEAIGAMMMLGAVAVLTDPWIAVGLGGGGLIVAAYAVAEGGGS